MKYKVEVTRTSTLTIEVETQGPEEDRGQARELAVEQAVHFSDEQWKNGYTEVETTGCEPA